MTDEVDVPIPVLDLAHALLDHRIGTVIQVDDCKLAVVDRGQRVDLGGTEFGASVDSRAAEVVPADLGVTGVCGEDVDVKIARRVGS